MQFCPVPSSTRDINSNGKSCAQASCTHLPHHHHHTRGQRTRWKTRLRCGTLRGLLFVPYSLLINLPIQSQMKSETKHTHFNSFGANPKISYLPWDLPGLYAKWCWITTWKLTEIYLFCVILCLDECKIILYFHRFSIFILFYKMRMIIVGLNLTAVN